MSKYKVVIPCAGTGSRLGDRTKFINKALITIGSKPVIVNIIEKFSKDLEIVILLGYKGEQIREVVQEFFPDRVFKFVEIDKFEGEGSGLGYSLLKAEKILNCPFIFVSNDTVILNEDIDIDPNQVGNWLGYYNKKIGDGFSISNYRTVNTNLDGEATSINSKESGTDKIYVGLCGVKDHETFWETMSTRPDAIESGEAIGLNALGEMMAKEYTQWYDCGSETSLKNAQHISANSDVNILEKQDEAIWFYNNKVVKFSINKSFIADRVNRMSFLPKANVPRLASSSTYLYSYEYVRGTVLSKTTDQQNFHKLLDTCYTKMWQKKASSQCDLQQFALKFYREKTIERLSYYMHRYEQSEKDCFINGQFVESAAKLLEMIDWDELVSKCWFSHFHGDLHGENIVVDENNNFMFLDWRQNFGDGQYEFGDAYYDLGKILHGLIVNHGQVVKNNFEVVDLKSNAVRFDILRLHSLVNAEASMEKWCSMHHFDYSHVRLITALIFLNICGLHEWPYARLLYLLGRSILSELVSSDES